MPNRLESLRYLLREIRQGRNTFYQRKLSDIDWEAAGESFAGFRREVPFTTKSEILADQKESPPFGNNLTYARNRYTRYCQTSGTRSGRPLPWLDTTESWQGMLACWEKVFEAAGVRAGEPVMFAFSFGPFLGFWSAYEAALERGNLCLPGGGLSGRSRLDLMARTGATTLCCTPTYALRLGEEAVDYPGLSVECVIVAGEAGGSLPLIRDQISERWGGAAVFDHHGMTEVGPVTYQDAGHPHHLCLIESAYFAEVIDPKDEMPVEEGAVGELVLTPLRRVGMPLLRYRTGDLVRLRREEIEGSQRMIFDGGILGRRDDMEVIRGVNVYPGAVEEIVRSFPEVVEYQVEIRTVREMREMFLEVELRTESPDLVARRLGEDIRDILGLRAHVKVAPAESLPRYEFKAKRWRRDEDGKSDSI
ncbi:MAG: phenylacetate--CoA ligase family protein [Verrucomicrobiota bacterium]